MNLKSGIAKVAGKSSYWFLHNVLKGGTSFPGKFAMKIDPEVLNSLAMRQSLLLELMVKQ